MRTIHCETCGAPRETSMPNTKYCTTCRLFKNIKFLGERTGTCVACNKKFALTERKAIICQECSAAAGDSRKGTCGVCKSENADLIWQDAAVCVRCMDDPTKRGPIVAGLVQKIARNKAEYGKVDE